jgi:hypothetical protein
MNQGLFLVLRAIAGFITLCGTILFLTFGLLVMLCLGFGSLVFIAGAFALDGLIYLGRQAKKLHGWLAK